MPWQRLEEFARQKQAELAAAGASLLWLWCESSFCFVLRRSAHSRLHCVFPCRFAEARARDVLVSSAATTAESRSSRTVADERKSREVSRSEPFDASHARGMLIDLILSAPRNDAFVLHHLKVCRSDPCGSIPTQSPHGSTVANASSRNV